MKRLAVLLFWFFAVTVTGFAQSSLADRIQAGDRKAALEMIRLSANVNAAQADGSTPLH